MKKFAFLTLGILLTKSSFALPIGNPSDPGLLFEGIWLCWADPCHPHESLQNAVNFRFGYYGDFVYNRNLQLVSPSPGSTIEDFRMQTNAALLVLNLGSRIDVFATLGQSQFQLRTSGNSLGVGSLEVQNVGSPTFSWSAGVRGLLVELGNTVLGAEWQYFQFCSDISRVVVGETSGFYPDEGSFFLNYREWQIGVALAHRIDFFIPYVGLSYARATGTNTQNGVVNRRMQAHNNWGYAVGVTAVAWDRASFNVEGRFADEKAVHVDLQIRL